MHGDGRDFAVGDLEYGAPGASVTEVRVTCSTVVGNRASVGGWITKATNPAVVGMAALIYLVDNGPTDSPTPDQSSPIFIGQPGVPGDFPATFPTVCLPPTGNPDEPAIFQDLRGDIVIGTGI